MLRSIDTPKANPENLLSLMRDAHAGKVVIPEFQRSFVWAREDIEELLVSILQGYFIGTFLMLDTPSDKPMFPFRTVEGLNKVNPGVAPQNYPTVRLALDGQQRITSLFYVLYEPPIPLKNTKNPYRFFFRLDRALDAEPEDAVYGISEADRRRTAEMENAVQAHRAIPFSLLQDASQFYRWFYNEQKFLQNDTDRKLIEAFYHRFQNFMVPVVALSQEAGKDNIVNIFERINRTGVTLSLFDLAVARLYLKGVLLRNLWAHFAAKNPDAIEVVKPEFLLKVIALWEGKEPRRGTLLDVIDELEKQRFEKQWNLATHFMAEAYTRVTATHGGYGAFDNAWIPYTTSMVPLAALLHAIEQRKGGEEMYRKLDQWYWANVFTQRYDSAVDTNSHKDMKEVLNWTEGGNQPDWMKNLSVDSLKLTVDEPRSALYRGMICLVVLEGARDFIDGQPANLNECQDDHIFPQSKFSKQGNVNVILNRTLISSNQVKGDKKPSEFLPLILKKHGGDPSRLQHTLNTHLISEKARKAMEEDDFEAFVEARHQLFRARIQQKLSGTVE